MIICNEYTAFEMCVDETDVPLCVFLFDVGELILILTESYHAYNCGWASFSCYSSGHSG